MMLVVMAGGCGVDQDVSASDYTEEEMVYFNWYSPVKDFYVPCDDVEGSQQEISTANE